VERSLKGLEKKSQKYYVERWEKRREGKEVVIPCKYRGLCDHKKKKTNKKTK
jgi:hypothetical protein